MDGLACVHCSGTWEMTKTTLPGAVYALMHGQSDSLRIGRQVKLIFVWCRIFVYRTNIRRNQWGVAWERPLIGWNVSQYCSLGKKMPYETDMVDFWNMKTDTQNCFWHWQTWCRLHNLLVALTSMVVRNGLWRLPERKVIYKHENRCDAPSGIGELNLVLSQGRGGPWCSWSS